VIDPYSSIWPRTFHRIPVIQVLLGTHIDGVFELSGTSVASDESRAMSVLRHLLLTLPIPTTPIVQSRSTEERGIALLELGTHLTHVVRQSETLHLTEHNQMNRHIALDVDLRSIAERNFLALGADASPIAGHMPSGGGSHMWLPIGNQKRSELATIVVRDDTGRVLPRMSSTELASAFAAGTVKMFRLLLDSGTLPNATGPSGQRELVRLLKERHSVRWLIESAVASMAQGADTRDPQSHLSLGPSNEAELIRSLACDAVDRLQDDGSYAFTAFMELLGFATLNYPLVVLLPRSKAPLYVEFDAPAISGSTTRNPRAHNIAQLVTPVRNYPLSYTTRVSRFTGSYHATLSVDSQLKVRRFVASSDSDQVSLERLVTDMRSIAAKYVELRADGRKLLEHELQSVAERLCGIVERRKGDELAFRQYLVAKNAKPKPPRLVAAGSARHLLRRFLDEENQCLEFLYKFAQLFRAGRFTKLVVTPSQEQSVASSSAPAIGIDAKMLLDLADKLELLQLGHDLAVDNDPREFGGHVYWHRAVATREQATLDPILVGVQAILVDDPPSLSASVGRMAAAVTATIVIVFGFVFKSPLWIFPFNGLDARSVQADAIVTVLLLVPGLLLTRMEIPLTNTILGQVRSQTRLLAYLCFASPAFLAMYVVKDGNLHSLIPQLGLYWCLVVTIVLFVASAWTKWTGGQCAMDNSPTPNWVRRQFGTQSRGWNFDRDVEFHGSAF